MELKVSELAEKTNTTKRTIHYYIGKGLLPPAEGLGIKSFYTEEHFFKILLIKKMQEEFLPLEEIRTRIISLSLDEIKEYLSEKKIPEKRAEESEIKGIQEFLKISFPFEMELIFPRELLEKNRENIESIKKYIEKLMIKD